jgi:hypothetical protein
LFLKEPEDYVAENYCYSPDTLQGIADKLSESYKKELRPVSSRDDVETTGAMLVLTQGSKWGTVLVQGDVAMCVGLTKMSPAQLCDALANKECMAALKRLNSMLEDMSSTLSPELLGLIISLEYWSSYASDGWKRKVQEVIQFTLSCCVLLGVLCLMLCIGCCCVQGTNRFLRGNEDALKEGQPCSQAHRAKECLMQLIKKLLPHTSNVAGVVDELFMEQSEVFYISIYHSCLIFVSNRI